MNRVCFLYDPEHAPECSNALWVALLLVPLPMLLLALAGAVPHQIAPAALLQRLVLLSPQPMAPRAEPVPLSSRGDLRAQRFRVSDNQYIRHSRNMLKAPASRRPKPALACVMRKRELAVHRC